MTGIELIAEERRRQIEEEGFDAEHDSLNSVDDLCAAAIAYAMCDIAGNEDVAEENWPWDSIWWKPKGRRKNLVRAAALLAAAIDRMDEEEQ